MHRRKPIEVGDHAAIDGLVEREEPGLMSQELADGDRLLAVLRELRPVGGDPLLVVEPPAGVGECQGHRRQALGGRVDDDHRVPFPRFARLLVSNAAPEIDDLLAAEIDTAGATQLTASSKVLGERVAHRFKAATDVSLYMEVCDGTHGPSPGTSVSACVDSARRWIPSNCCRCMMKWTARMATLVSCSGSPWNR